MNTCGRRILNKKKGTLHLKSFGFNQCKIKPFVLVATSVFKLEWLFNSSCCLRTEFKIRDIFERDTAGPYRSRMAVPYQTSVSIRDYWYGAESRLIQYSRPQRPFKRHAHRYDRMGFQKRNVYISETNLISKSAYFM